MSVVGINLGPKPADLPPALVWPTSPSHLAALSMLSHHHRTTPRHHGAVHGVAQVQVPGPKNIPPAKLYNKPQLLRRSIFGEVHRATDLVTGHPVAIKLSNRRLLSHGRTADNIHVLENPRAEAAIMRRLPVHPNIVRMVREHQDDSWHWLVMEYCPRGDLFDTLSRQPHTRFSEPMARRLVKQMLRGLGAVHAAGVAHLDFSLENIFLSAAGTAKLADFGVARSFRRGIKHPGVVGPKPGKLRYMDPDVYAGRAFHADGADMWAFGVSLWCLLLGFPPFETPTMSDQCFAFLASHSASQLMNNFRLSHKPLLSPAAVSFLDYVLQIDPKLRPTAEQALQHPWLQDQH